MAKFTFILVVFILMMSLGLEAKKRKKGKKTKPDDPVCKKSDVKTLTESLSVMQVEMMKCCEGNKGENTENVCNLEGLVKLEDLAEIIENQHKMNASLNQLVANNAVINGRFDKIDKSLAERKPTEPEEKEIYPKDCTDVPGYTGVKEIQTEDGRKFDAYCKRGWLYLSRRFDGSVDFYKTYAEYQSSFGDRNGEYFLGLDNLVSVLKQGRYTLRVDLKMWPPANTEAYAQYSTFRVGDATDGYRLHVGGYTGTAGDSLGHSTYHQNMKFSTKDNDQDTHSGSCAQLYKGAGWYGACHIANLFGKYSKSSLCPEFAACMSWYHWPKNIGNPNNHYYSFKEAAMKLYRQ